MQFGRRRALLFSLYAVSGLVIGSLFGWLAFRDRDWRQVASALEEASLALFLVALGLVFLAAVIRAYRWWLLFPRERVSVRRLYVVEHAGLGANIISPVRVLAEPVQFGLLNLRDRLRSGDIVASLSLQRTSDLMATVVLFAFGVALLPALEGFGPFALAGAVLAAAVMLSPFVILPMAARNQRARGFPIVRTFLEVLPEFRRRRREAVGVVAASFVYWVMVGAIGWIVAVGFGIEIGFFPMVVLVLAIIVFSTSVPGLPGAVGTFEAAAIFLLEQWAVPNETALGFALVLHGALYLPPLLIAAIALPLEGVRSIDSLRALVTHYHRPQEAKEHEEGSGQARAA